MRIIKDRYFVLLSLGIALGCFPLLSAVRTLAAPAPGPAPAAGAATNAAVVEDSLGRTTPQGTFLGFIRAAEKEEYRLASNYLEGKQSAAEKERVARQLKVLLDRVTGIDADSLSKKPEGDPENAPAPGQQRVAVAKYENQSLEILLRRVEQKGGSRIVSTRISRLSFDSGGRMWAKMNWSRGACFRSQYKR